MVEGVGVHLDGFVDGFGPRVGREVAEGFEESLQVRPKRMRVSDLSIYLSFIQSLNQSLNQSIN